MKKLWIVCFSVFPCLAFADPPEPRTIDFAGRVAPALETYQANQKTYKWTLQMNAGTVDGRGQIPIMWWATAPGASACVTASCSWVTASSGTFNAIFSPSDLNTNGTFIYGVGMTSNNYTSARLGVIKINRDPYASGAGATTFSSNLNASLFNWIGSFNNKFWIPTNAPDASANVLVGSFTNTYWSTAGVGDFLRDGSAAMTGPLNFGGQKGTNIADGTSAKDVLAWGQFNSATSTIGPATNEMNGRLATALQPASTQTWDIALSVKPADTNGAIWSGFGSVAFSNPTVFASSGEFVTFTNLNRAATNNLQTEIDTLGTATGTINSAFLSHTNIVGLSTASINTAFNTFSNAMVISSNNLQLEINTLGTGTQTMVSVFNTFSNTVVLSTNNLQTEINTLGTATGTINSAFNNFSNTVVQSTNNLQIEAGSWVSNSNVLYWLDGRYPLSAPMNAGGQTISNFNELISAGDITLRDEANKNGLGTSTGSGEAYITGSNSASLNVNGSPKLVAWSDRLDANNLPFTNLGLVAWSYLPSYLATNGGSYTFGGSIDRATTVTGSQSNTIESALQPAGTNGWHLVVAGTTNVYLPTNTAAATYLPIAGTNTLLSTNVATDTYLPKTGTNGVFLNIGDNLNAGVLTNRPLTLCAPFWGTNDAGNVQWYGPFDANVTLSKCYGEGAEGTVLILERTTNASVSVWATNLQFVIEAAGSTAVSNSFGDATIDAGNTIGIKPTMNTGTPGYIRLWGTY